MSEVNSKHDDEIDLMELLITLWKGKWKIIFITFVFTLSAIGAHLLLPSKFTATTEIRPISSVVADRYRASNALGFFEISRSFLINLYTEQLEENDLFESAIRDFSLLSKDDFEDEQDYQEAVVKLASSIKLVPPANADEPSNAESRRFWKVEVDYHNEDKWKEVLTAVRDEANKAVRQIIRERFDTSFAIAERSNKFLIEDAETQIENALSDYQRQTSDRLEFLEEQSKIARALGVAKNTIEVQSFGSQAGLIANIETNVPFYLRGYEAIEKEMELTRSRSNTNAFVGDLLPLEQQRRAVEQNKTLARAKSSFASTPIMQSNDFLAASMKIESTKFDYKRSLTIMFGLALVLGSMIGVLYVLISNAVLHRKDETTV